MGTNNQLKTFVCTPGELETLKSLSGRLANLCAFLSGNNIPSEDSSQITWYQFLREIKNSAGSINNDMSFIATILARKYLIDKHGLIDFCAAKKSQSAPGLDINFEAHGGRVVAEVKTTYPYNETDFGAAQKDAFLADFDKLHRAQSVHKYLFVTESVTYEVLRKKYCSYLEGIMVVSLLDDRQFVGN